MTIEDKITDKSLFEELKENLSEYDEINYNERFTRLYKLSLLCPEELLIVGISETVILYNEIKETYVNGQLLASIILIQTFIEKLFYNHLKNIDSEIEVNGLFNMIKYSKENNLFDIEFLDLIDKLRKIRNPLVHQNKIKFEERLFQRCHANCNSAYIQLEKEVDEALILLFSIIRTKTFIFDNGVEFIEM